jgi:hypothetical protein
MFVVGSNPLPPEVAAELGDLIARLNETHYFKNGSTAAFWHLSAVLAQHLGEGRE